MIQLYKIKKIFYIILTLAYIFAILYYSLQSSKGGYGGVEREAFNNFLHIPAYAVLAYLVLHCFSSLTIKIYFLTGIIAIGYGVFIEFCQSYIPGRFSSMMDISLNTIGVILSLSFHFYFNARRNTLPTGRQAQFSKRD